MNLTELYAKTPTSLHSGIVVTAGGMVFVRGKGGLVDEYYMKGDGNIELMRSDKLIVEAVLAAIPELVDKSDKVKEIRAKVDAL